MLQIGLSIRGHGRIESLAESSSIFTEKLRVDINYDEIDRCQPADTVRDSAQ